MLTYFGFLEELIQKGFVPRTQGCSVEEINTLEELIQAPLPKAYYEFLLLAGKDSPWHNAEAGNFFCGFEYMLNNIPKIVESYVEMGMDDLEIPHDFIPLWEHDGFSYIRLYGGENPPVFTFWGGPSAKHFLSNDTFLGYIIKLVQHTLIDYSKFGTETGWSINSKIDISAKKDTMHSWRILSEKEF